MKFKPGQIVQLTGQGIWMTVSHCFGIDDNEQAVCLWFDNKARLQRDNIFVSLLIPVDMLPLKPGSVGN